jgi:formate-nitrite transporter family protein
MDLAVSGKPVAMEAESLPRVAVHAGGDDGAETPSALWEQAVGEGSDRLERSAAAEASTALIGGVDVMLGVIAAATVAGALGTAVNHQLAAVIGSLAFGIGFVFVTIGRSELFTENFLIPVSTIYAGKAQLRDLARTWTITLVANVVGLFALAAIFSKAGVFEHGALVAAGHTADTLATRGALSAFLSAIVAGIVMTMWTWLSLAARTDIGRIAVALVVGFLLTSTVLNHVVVSTGEMLLALFAGTTHAGWGDLWANFGIALGGNLVGGVGFVTISRAAQANGH